jgi:hypothetical protein
MNKKVIGYILGFVLFGIPIIYAVISMIIGAFEGGLESIYYLCGALFILFGVVISTILDRKLGEGWFAKAITLVMGGVYIAASLWLIDRISTTQHFHFLLDWLLRISAIVFWSWKIHKGLVQISEQQRKEQSSEGHSLKEVVSQTTTFADSATDLGLQEKKQPEQSNKGTSTPQDENLYSGILDVTWSNDKVGQTFITSVGRKGQSLSNTKQESPVSGKEDQQHQHKMKATEGQSNKPTERVKLTEEEYQQRLKDIEVQKRRSTTQHFDRNKPPITKERLEEVLTMARMTKEELDNHLKEREAKCSPKKETAKQKQKRRREAKERKLNNAVDKSIPTDQPSSDTSTPQRELPYSGILGGSWKYDKVGQTFVTKIGKHGQGQNNTKHEIQQTEKQKRDDRWEGIIKLLMEDGLTREQAEAKINSW